MEPQKPVLGQRKTSAFNPEAMAFSPTHVAAISNSKDSTGPVIATPPAIPREPFKSSTILKHDSSLRPAENMRPVYHGEAATSRVPLGLEDLLAEGVPLEALQRMLLEHHVASNRAKTVIPRQKHALTTDTGRWPVTQPPPISLPALRPEPSFNAVDVDELSASLGLPCVKHNMFDGSLARSHKSRPSHEAHDPLVGKLIGKALDTPLTANALAKHLNTGKSMSLVDMATASRQFQESLMGFGTADHEDGKATKMVRPPPGFHGTASREIYLEDDTPVPAAVPELQYVPTGPADFHGARLRSPFQAVKHVRYHPRRPSNQRRPRAHTRAKRTDQGPEPSAADIYPDDANWEPSYMPCNGRETVYRRPSFVPQLTPQRELQVSNTVSWPTPAEVYTQTAPTGTYTHKPVTPPRSPTINIFENYVPPTAADINAADDDVLTLINELPKPSIPTLLKFEAYDLICDERPLTPGQEDGSRYGLKNYGLGLGDPWNCPHAEEGNPFRVRPRNHEGWGGWEWALKSGWGDE